LDSLKKKEAVPFTVAFRLRKEKSRDVYVKEENIIVTVSPYDPCTTSLQVLQKYSVLISESKWIFFPSSYGQSRTRKTMAKMEEKKEGNRKLMVLSLSLLSSSSLFSHFGRR
jgi:hypothetical protein